MPHAQRKGSSGERELAKLLMDWAKPTGVILNLERNLEQVRHGGADINGVEGLEIEVKRREKISVESWWRQVCTAAEKSGKRPMLAWRPNRKPWKFRVRGYSVLYEPEFNNPQVIEIDMDLEYMEAKKWFQMYVYQTMGNHLT